MISLNLHPSSKPLLHLAYLPPSAMISYTITMTIFLYFKPFNVFPQIQSIDQRDLEVSEILLPSPLTATTPGLDGSLLTISEEGSVSPDGTQETPYPKWACIVSTNTLPLPKSLLPWLWKPLEHNRNLALVVCILPRLISSYIAVVFDIQQWQEY